MTNDEMIIIIRRWTVKFFVDEWANGSVKITIKFGQMIEERPLDYDTMDSAIEDSFKRTKLIVMAVCGDIERDKSI